MNAEFNLPLVDPLVTDSPAKLRLAMVSPLPPAKSGIAYYTEDLWPSLALHYDITLIDSTPANLLDRSTQPTEVEAAHDLNWLLENADQFDRIVYHMGNSGFHTGVLHALEQAPGVVVLHDFYIGDGLWWEQEHGYSSIWHDALLYEHGFKALATGYRRAGESIRNYPLNERVFRDARAVIVHSQYARNLVMQWHGQDAVQKTHVVKLAKPMGRPIEKSQARQALGLADADFIVCSFGYVGPQKMHDRILKAWAMSHLSDQANCKLIFVGQNHTGAFGTELREAIDNLPNPEQVSITGFVSKEQFEQYLAAADLAVQLRRDSRGETSGVCADVMSYGLAQIVNANGAFAEIPPDACCLLPDAFEDHELTQAFNDLYAHADKRAAMSVAARQHISNDHAPSQCALDYRDIIEAAYASEPIPLKPKRRLFLDMTATQASGLQSGIERVALALCEELIDLEPTFGLVVPVYLEQDNGQWVHFQANELMARRLDIKSDVLIDHPINPEPGDVLLTLDLSADVLCRANDEGLFEDYRADGVAIGSIVFDLLPIRMPQMFPPGANQTHERWLGTVAKFDGALCISKHVADDLRKWLDERDIDHQHYRIDTFVLGSNTQTFNSQQRQFKSPDRPRIIRAPSSTRRAFLMVGTIEPRKGYLEVLDAFEALWAQGFDYRLVIVGREGWVGLPDIERRDIPQTVERLTDHPETYERLIWINNADDRKLEQAYAYADCLIAASYGEGFGLPIIEATQHGLPVLARDIEVFREVAPEGTRFFTSKDLTDALIWWKPPEEGSEDRPEAEKIHTWRDSAEQVLDWVDELKPSSLTASSSHESAK